MASHIATNVVFVDTNLDTRLALDVSDLHTVSDLKESILSEHPLCFPRFGQIQIHGIKVKRKGHFYYLSDSMLVKSAFTGSNKSWFLSVDASALGECAQNEQSFSHGSPNPVVSLGVANNALIVDGDNAVSFPSRRVFNKQDGNEEMPLVSLCVSQHTGKEAVNNVDVAVKSSGNNDTGILLPGSVPETEEHCFVNHEPSGLQMECDVGGSSKGVKNYRNVCEEDPPISMSRAKKKRKRKKKKKDMVQDDNSKDETATVGNPLSFPFKTETSLQVLQLENKQDEIEEITVPEHAREVVVRNLEMDVNSSGNNNDPSIPETRDYGCVNHELPDSRVELEVDGTNEGIIKDDCVVFEEGNSKSVPKAKKRKRKKKKYTMQDDNSKEHETSVVGPGNYTVQQDVVIVANLSENADKEVIKETEVLKDNNNNTKNDIDADVSMKEASQPGSTSDKTRKRKRRKVSLTLDSKEISEVETSYQKEKVQKSDKAHWERKEPKDQFELSNEKSKDGKNEDKTTGDVLDPRLPAKKEKGKEKSGKKSLSKAKLINDFNVDNASPHSLEDQQKIKNSSTDRSAEHFNVTDSLRTSVPSQKRKVKINSSNPHEIPVVTSSKKDEEADRASIQKRDVQEQISEDGLLSKDVSMSKTIIGNMDDGTDACREGIQSAEKRTVNCRNHSDVETKVHPSDVDVPMELTVDNEKVDLDHSHENEADQMERTEEGNEASPQKSTPSNQENTDASFMELVVTSKVVDVNGMTEPVKSGEPASRKGIGLVDGSESETIIVKSLSATNCGPVSGNTKADDNPLNQTEGERIQHEEMQGTIIFVTEKENEPSADDTVFSEQIKTKSGAEQVDKRRRKKSNNKQTSTSNSKDMSNMPKDQVLDSKKPSLSSEGATHSKPSVEVTKKTKSPNTKSSNKSSKANLEPTIDSVRLEPSDSQFNSESNGATQHSTRFPGREDDNNLEAPSKTSNIDTDQQFSSQELHEANLSDDVPVDKMDRTNIETMTAKNKHGLEATNVQTHARVLRSSQRLSSKAGHDVLSIHPDKVTNVHRTGQNSKLSGRSDSGMSSIGENRKARVNASKKSVDLEKQREHVPISNSKLECHKKKVQNKSEKASVNKIRGAPRKTQQKSLLAGAIFKDDSSSTSEDEVDNSDTSTRTPSDNPLLSDSSDEDSSSGLHSQENDLRGGKSLENGGRSSTKASLSSIKGMPIDHVLRSSSRFKKAKTTASQLEETESQPEVVPDSLTY